jgi:hypothetical protein
MSAGSLILPAELVAGHFALFGADYIDVVINKPPDVPLKGRVLHILQFMEAQLGPAPRGHHIVDSESSMPEAILPIMLAVAGATMKISAFAVSSI